MAYVSERLPRRSGTTALFAIAALAAWQLRQTWRFIILAGMGMVAAIVLVCTGPLYSLVALNASVREFIASDPGHSTILLQGRMQTLSARLVQQASTEFTHAVARDIGPAVPAASQFYMQSPVFSLLASNPTLPTANGKAPEVSNSQVILDGYGRQDLPAHVNIVAGRLPNANAGSINEVEIALTPAMAQSLHMQVGDAFYVSPPSFGSNRWTYWALRVVGLVTPRSVSDRYWHGETFQVQQQKNLANAFYATCLTSSDALITSLSQPDVTNQPTLYWQYHIDPARVDAAQVGQLVAGLHTFLTDVSSNPIIGIDQSSSPAGSLDVYNNRMALAQVSVGLLLVLVIGMILLFISLMADLLVEQRIEAIALLRSRGASRSQVFAIFAAQTLGLGLLALVIGVLLALPLARYLLFHFLPVGDQATITSNIGTPLAALQKVWPFALAALAVILLTMLAALFRETRFDVLALRREAARSTRRPLWMRLYLDFLIAVLALSGYGYALYATRAAQLSAQATIQTFSPLILLTSACFLLAGLLLFLRFFPVLLRRATVLASRRGSVGSMLALAQMARSPQRALRTTLLFTLATAFAIFTLVFMATQSQRIFDVASYQTGADFSGQFADTTTKLPTLLASYRAIPGVTSVTLGTISSAQRDTFTANIKAVDASTFAQTAIWTPQYSSQPLQSLLAQLIAQRRTARTLGVLPAIMDAASWKALHLKPGAVFTLTFYFSNADYNPALQGVTNQVTGTSVDIPFKALTQVQHIPTMVDTSQSATFTDTGSSPSSQMGILVDYQSLAAAYERARITLVQNPANSFLPKTFPLNYVWLRTSEQANLAHMRATLNKRLLPGTTLLDRQAFVDVLQHDPFYLDLLGILTLGMFTPLFLALLSSLLTSWLTAYSRLTGFAVLRALGSAPRQLAGILTWEQGIVYTIMFGLGLLAGALLSLMVLPALVLTDVASIGGSTSSPTSGAAFLQDLPALQVILPASLSIVLGLLLGISIFALVMMIVMVSRPSVSQTLRLNVD